jgi:glycosyltransferase involved in cell wall biosynthesis
MKNPVVIVLNDYCHINGGASKVAVDEAVGLAESGAKVIFVGACAPVCPELENADLQVICLGQTELINAGKNPLVMLQGLWNFKAARAMRALLKGMDKKNTIIHLHGYTKALTTSPVRVASKLGFKVVCTLHDFFPACPNGAFFDYVKCKPCPKRAMSWDCITTQCDKRHYVHKLYRVARTFIQKNIGRFPAGVKDYITLSRQSASLLRPYLPAGSNYYPLENPIPVPESPPVNVKANRQVVAVGRLDAEKGVEILLAAAKEAGVALTFIGDGPLRPLAESHAFCRVTGWLKPAQVIEELEKARCLVFPSLWYETYGLVVAEAAAKGVPAIVSDISAAAERVVNGKTGWHMRSGDVEDLKRCLLLTHDDETIGRAGKAAYDAFWAAPPVRSRHIEGLLHIYNTVPKGA